MVFLNILISVVLWGSVIAAVINILSRGGISFGKSPVMSRLCMESAVVSESIESRELLKIAVYAFCFRIFVYIAGAAAFLLFSSKGSDVSFIAYISRWNQWDATHYIRIAESGYSYVEDGKNLMLVFFPFYPVCIRITQFFVRDYRIAGMLVSSIMYAIGCAYMYGLVSMEIGKNAAKNAVKYISVFPFAFFFGAIMTESTFFMTTAAALYYIKKQNWEMVCAFGILSALTRMIGVIIIIPALIEWCEYYKPFGLIKSRKFKDLWKIFYKHCIFIILIVSGTLAYLFINYKVTGNPFEFMIYQKEHWHHENQYFAKTITDILKYAVSSDTDSMLRGAIWIPEIITIMLSLAAIVYSALKRRNIYTIYLAAYFVINCSVSWLISGARYMSAAVPLFIILSEFTNKHKQLDKPVTIGFSVFMGIYLAGFLFSKQIL